MTELKKKNQQYALPINLKKHEEIIELEDRSIENIQSKEQKEQNSKGDWIKMAMQEGPELTCCHGHTTSTATQRTVPYEGNPKLAEQLLHIGEEGKTHSKMGGRD